MSVEIIKRVKCDRCNKVIGDSKDVEEHTSDKPLYHVEEQGEIVVTLKDLCGKCTSRVGALIKQIRLDISNSKKEDSLDVNDEEDQEEDQEQDTQEE